MQRIGFIIFDGFQSMNLAALSVFEYANYTADKPRYDLRVISEKGGLVRSSTGMMVGTEAFDKRPFDTLLIGGHPLSDAARTSSPGLLTYLRKGEKAGRRIASFCVGAFKLAEAGILDGRKATTHWGHARELRSRYPKVQVEEDRIFVIDGSVWTSAGMTAGLDLALEMVEQDLGAEIARSVAQKLVFYHRRGGGQSQHSALLELEPKSDRIQKALVYAKANLHAPLSVERLAEVVHLSPRQFSRAFRAETGQSPAKAVEGLRLEAARLMLEQSCHPVDLVARETGFFDPRRMRQAFLRKFGQPPQIIRRNARVG
jgi:transcriptional regulator GlxA family with amidase domain